MRSMIVLLAVVCGAMAQWGPAPAAPAYGGAAPGVPADTPEVAAAKAAHFAALARAGSPPQNPAPYNQAPYNPAPYNAAQRWQGPVALPPGFDRNGAPLPVQDTPEVQAEKAKHFALAGRSQAPGAPAWNAPAPAWNAPAPAWNAPAPAPAWNAQAQQDNGQYNPAWNSPPSSGAYDNGEYNPAWDNPSYTGDNGQYNPSWNSPAPSWNSAAPAWNSPAPAAAPGVPADTPEVAAAKAAHFAAVAAAGHSG